MVPKKVVGFQCPLPYVHPISFFIWALLFTYRRILYQPSSNLTGCTTTSWPMCKLIMGRICATHNFSTDQCACWLMANTCGISTACIEVEIKERRDGASREMVLQKKWDERDNTLMEVQRMSDWGFGDRPAIFSVFCLQYSSLHWCKALFISKISAVLTQRQAKPLRGQQIGHD